MVYASDFIFLFPYVAGFTPWQLGNQSGTDEVFMAAQEAVNAHRDSQGRHLLPCHTQCGVINVRLSILNSTFYFIFNIDIL